MKSDERGEQEPARLLERSGSEAPADLVRALRALRSERPSAALMERVSERLQQSAGLPPSASTTASSVQAGLASKWIVGVLAVTVAGSTAAWMWSRSAPQAGAATQLRSPVTASLEPTPAARSPIAEATARSEQPPAAAAEKQTKVAAIQRPKAVGARAQDVPERDAAPRSGKAANASSKRTRSRAEPAARSPAASATSAVAVRSSANASMPIAPVEQAQPSPLLREQAPPKAPAKDEDARAAQPTMGEAQLLVRARGLAAHDPSRAFALLSEHERRYPDGLLVVEREVLAIEVLRLLERTEDASRRLRAFRERYPDSPHVRRLTRP